MRALVHEGRRLFGIRSTWFVLLATVATAAVVSAVTARQADAGPLSAPQAVRLLTAAVPLLPLPLAALGAGVLGALSYGREARHPAACASLVSTSRRLRLLGAKLTVVGITSVLTALVTVAVDAAVLRFTLPSGVQADPVLHAGHLPPALFGYAVLVAAAAWAALLAAGLLRNAAAGLLVLLVLSGVAEPGADVLLRHSGATWAEHISTLLPFRSGRDWVYGAAHGSHGPFTAAYVAPVALALVPAGVLLLVGVAANLRRRTV